MSPSPISNTKTKGRTYIHKKQFKKASSEKNAHTQINQYLVIQDFNEVY